jgi:hypothetical protein
VRAPTHISSCLELNLGDEINATYKGALVHHGHVTELAPDHNLFWILDDFVGGRRLIDMVELSIYRIPAAATN